MNKLTASYLAGFIDGEGSLEIRKHKRNGNYGVYYEGKLRISQANKDIIEWLKNSFGGYMENGKNNHGSEYYCWTLKNTVKLLPFIQRIIPYLRLKKERAELLRKFMKRKLLTRRADGTYEHLSPQELKIREEMFQSMKQLNIKPLHAKRLSEETLRMQGSDSPILQVIGE